MSVSLAIKPNCLDKPRATAPGDENINDIVILIKGASNNNLEHFATLGFNLNGGEVRQRNGMGKATADLIEIPAPGMRPPTKGDRA